VFATDDLQGAAREAMRPFLALYVGGLGSRKQNSTKTRPLGCYGVEAMRQAVSRITHGRQALGGSCGPDGWLIDQVRCRLRPTWCAGRLEVYSERLRDGHARGHPVAFTAEDRMKQVCGSVAELAAS